jgi:hypothetical protein
MSEGELFDFATEKRKRRTDQSIRRKPYDGMRGEPPLLASAADVSKIPTEELSRLVQTDNLAYMLLGVEHMIGTNRWSDDEVAEYAQEINDTLNGLSNEEREAVFKRVYVIKEYEAEHLKDQLEEKEL